MGRITTPFFPQKFAMFQTYTKMMVSGTIINMGYVFVEILKLFW